jgi:basic membrane protein A
VPPTDVPATAVVEPTVAPTDVPATEAPTEAAATEAPTEAPAAGGLVCEVTDTGGVDDKSFNQLAWVGAQDVAEEVGWEAKYLESTSDADYPTNINEFVSQKCDLIVTVGFLLGDATLEAAKANPEQSFLILDNAYGEDVPNVYQQVYATEEGAFLAGYVAASFTKTGKVGTFGGINIPPVADFMVGFQQGVEYYNEQKGAEVELIGWDNEAKDGLFTGDFNDLVKGGEQAKALMSEGADIILPVAGPVGLGAAAEVQKAGSAYIIGVDSDWYESAAEYSDIILTSVLKRLDVSVATATKAVVDGSFAGGIQVGNLANGQIGIAPFHDYEGEVDPALAGEIETIQAAIIAGDIDVLNFSELP